MKIDMDKLRGNFEKYEKQAAEDLIDRCARRAREHQIEDIARKAHGYPEGDMEWELRFYSGGM
jgi:hypothetical protein